MKGVVRFLVIAFSLISLALSLPEEKACGFPGIPHNCQMIFHYSRTVSRFNYSEISHNEFIINGSWPVKTRVEYECEMLQKFQLNGSKERICQENGTWTERLPFCDENVAYGKEVLINNVKNRESEPTSLLTDGKTVGKNSGIYLDGVHNNQLILRFDSPLNIRSVIIHVNDNENWEENIPTVWRNIERQDASEISRDSNKSIEWIFPDNRLLTQNLSIFHFSKAKFLVTEMQVFISSNATCGYPEVPVDGSVTLFYDHFNPLAALYSCTPGFQLVGSLNRTCTEGIWYEQVPICKVIPITAPLLYSTSVTEETTTVNESLVTPTLLLNGKRDPVLDQIEGKDTELHSVTCSSKPSDNSLVIIIVVLSIVLGIFISVHITLFLCKKRKKGRKHQVESNSSHAEQYSGYEVPLMLTLPLAKLNVVPNQKIRTENIYEVTEHCYAEIR